MVCEISLESLVLLKNWELDGISTIGQHKVATNEGLEDSEL